METKPKPKRERIDRVFVRGSGWRATAGAVASMTLGGVIIITFAEPLARVFTDDAEVIALTTIAMPVTVTRIASGVPMGGDLKYVDQVTLKRAMESRHGI